MFGRFSRLRHLPYLSFSVALLLVVYGIGYHYIGYHYPHSLTNQLVKDWADAKEGGGLMGEHGLSLGAAEALKEKYDPLPILERSSGSSSHVESFAEPGFGHGSLEQDSLLNGSEQDIRDSVEGTDALSIAHKSVSKIDVGRGNRSMADLTLDGETGDHSGLRLSLKDISIPSTTSTSAQKQTGDSGRTAGDVTSKHEEWKRRMRVRLLNADSHWNFSLPWANAYNASFTKSSKWFRLLLYYTQTFDPSEPVITVCADTSFIDGLINWLISALVLQKHPPKNILIVTNEAKVCWFLSVHKVPVRCLKLFSESVLSEEGMKQVKKRKLTRLLVIRMSVMRILNHLGYDVLNMDADAIMLKNIIPVLELNRDSDIVGTIGGGLPKPLFHKWGVVVCMGAILIRSTPATEHFWEKMKEIPGLVDDQILFNTALKAVDISWKSTPSHYNLSTEANLQGVNSSWVGHTPSGLKVTLLPHIVACRSASCAKELRNIVYIWHRRRTKHEKSTAEQAMDDGVWFVNKAGSGEGTGMEWLVSMANVK